jgi:orotidine-5'-phosphate decarboxylase
MGGKMTHSRQLEGDISNSKDVDYTELFTEGFGFTRDLTGYIRASAPDDIFTLAARMGVTDYVVPGNDPDAIILMKILLENEKVNPVFYSPGLVTQGGDISKAGRVAGDRFHGIVGSGIYKSEDIRRAAEELTSKL